MFRDREEGDCKGNSYNPAYQGLVTRVWGKHALASIQNPPVNIIYFFFFKGESSRYKALFTLHDFQSQWRAGPFTLHDWLRPGVLGVYTSRLIGDRSVYTTRLGGGQVADAT